MLKQVPVSDKTEITKALFEELSEELARLHLIDGKPDKAQTEQRINSLIEACTAEIMEQKASGKQSGLFLKELETLIKQVELSSGEIANLQNVISKIRKIILFGNPGTNLTRAEDIWGQGRVMVGEAARRSEARERLDIERANREIIRFEQNLLTTFDFPVLMRLVSSELPLLGIQRGYIYFYKDRQEPLAGLCRVLEFSKEGYTVYDTLPAADKLELVPDTVFSGDVPRAFISEALYFNEEQIGFITLESDLDDCAVYDTLRALLSSALEGSFQIGRAHV